MAPVNLLISLVVFGFLALLQVVQSESNCTLIGLRCSDDCQSIQLCPMTGVEPLLAVDCIKMRNRLCQKSTISGKFDCFGEQCSSPNIPHPFTCTGAGTFPSAYNCDVSYICAGVGKPTKICRCDVGQFYDAAAEICVKGPGCPLIPADCSNLGQVGKLGNGFCYACDQTYQAMVYRCPLRKTIAATPSYMDMDPFSSDKYKGMTCRDYHEPIKVKLDIGIKKNKIRSYFTSRSYAIYNNVVKELAYKIDVV